MAWWRHLFSSGGLSAAGLRDEIRAILRFRDPVTARDQIIEHLSHLTQKSGALLAAQALFIVVDTWGMEHDWPRVAVVVSIVSLVSAALIVLTLLRSFYLPSPRVDDPETVVLEEIFAVARIMASRAARFNIALYLTFLSVVLLGFGAIEASLG